MRISSVLTGVLSVWKLADTAINLTFDSQDNKEDHPPSATTPSGQPRLYTCVFDCLGPKVPVWYVARTPPK